ncbi:MAG TPA: hypothetical protein VHJ00_17215 [Bradyrhizobium sp.]|jgi:hypothetical protein|nr:hypothetical protein [Bradyrhizobium sp.]
MRGRFFHIALPLGVALALAGCGFADVRSPVPEFMRNKEADPPPPEPPPDVRRLVHDNLDAVFVANSYPRDIQVSPAHHEVRGTGWTACVRAEVNSATGAPIGVQTYRISISGGLIIDRRRVDPDDNCETESYEPI